MRGPKAYHFNKYYAFFFLLNIKVIINSLMKCVHATMYVSNISAAKENQTKNVRVNVDIYNIYSV